MKNNNNIPVIILCGGEGLRLRPLTKNIPKPLIRINNKPILLYVLKHLKKYGYNEFIIATGYKSKKIKDFMEDKFNKLNYRIVDSGNVDILARIKDCLKYVKGDFLLCYGDTISNINFKKLNQYHFEDSSSVTISSFPITIPFGVMNLDKSNYVRSFIEKPRLDSVMNIGYFYFTSQSHQIVKKCKSLIDVLKKLINKKKLKCYNHEGIHITINTIAELEYANKNITKLFK